MWIAPWITLVLAAVAVAPPGAEGSWIVNHGTEGTSLAVGSSGVAGGGEDRKPFQAVDGVVTTDWDAALDAKDSSCWLTLDFGGTVTLTAIAVTQRGDSTHDTKDHEMQTGSSISGPWETVGSWTAKECKPPDFPAAECQPDTTVANSGGYRQVRAPPPPPPTPTLTHTTAQLD